MRGFGRVSFFDWPTGFAFWLPLLGGTFLCVSTACAQPNQPKKAPVPPRIVPGSGNPTVDPIKPDSGPQKIGITPPNSVQKQVTPDSPSGVQKPLNPTPFKVPSDARIDPTDLNLSKTQINRFVIALCADKQGRLWIGTEDEGVWRYDEKAPIRNRWRQFTTKDGLGDDNAYAVACDQQGRIWIGHLNHGVSVFNGERWKNYDVLDGPLGERVFDIAVAPTDGSVWIATSAGLTRYLAKKDDWAYFTRAEGLPSDQIAALAFNKQGDLFAGTQCDGLAIARAADDYKTWQSVRGPERMPNTPIGKGLPSNLINDVLVTKDQSVYAATTCGIARSFDNGASWDYIRGADWEAKVKGLYKGPEPKQMTLPGDLLLEDYSTCLAEDSKGQIYVGHWRRGYEVRAHKNENRLAYKSNPDFVAALLPTSKQTLLGFYGGGVRSLVDEKVEADFQLPVASVAKPSVLESPTLNPQQITTIDVPIENVAKGQPPVANPVNIALTSQAAPPSTFAVLPSVAKPLSAEDMEQLQVQLEGSKTKQSKFSNVTLEGDDWRTGGDWTGRYGRQLAVLCAAQSPFNHQFMYDPAYQVKGTIGPHNKKDYLRLWLHWPKSENPRVLYDPQIGARRQADWDDHGETYPFDWQGPDVWVQITVPEGMHRLSLYFFNKDGHESANRLRDYLVEIKGSAATPADAELAPTLARTRVCNFWGGVYKRFILKEAGTYWVRIGRNNSFNTTLAGVLLDKVDGPPSKIMGLNRHWMGKVRYDPPMFPAFLPINAPARSDAEKQWRAAWNLWDLFEEEQFIVQPVCWKARLLAYRAALKSAAPSELLDHWRWQLPLWTDTDRSEWKDTMAQAWQSYQEERKKPRSVTISIAAP